jgi:hypothetical protein
LAALTAATSMARESSSVVGAIPRLGLAAGPLKSCRRLGACWPAGVGGRGNAGAWSGASMGTGPVLLR